MRMHVCRAQTCGHSTAMHAVKHTSHGLRHHWIERWAVTWCTNFRIKKSRLAPGRQLRARICTDILNGERNWFWWHLLLLIVVVLLWALAGPDIVFCRFNDFSRLVRLYVCMKGLDGVEATEAEGATKITNHDSLAWMRMAGMSTKGGELWEPTIARVAHIWLHFRRISLAAGSLQSNSLVLWYQSKLRAWWSFETSACAVVNKCLVIISIVHQWGGASTDWYILSLRIVTSHPTVATTIVVMAIWLIRNWWSLWIHGDKQAFRWRSDRLMHISCQVFGA